MREKILVVENKQKTLIIWFKKRRRLFLEGLKVVPLLMALTWFSSQSREDPVHSVTKRNMFQDHLLNWSQKHFTSFYSE